MRLEERFFCCLSIKRLMIICTLLIITLILQHKIISLLTARVYCVKFTLLMGKLQNMFMKFAKISRPLQDLCDKQKNLLTQFRPRIYALVPNSFDIIYFTQNFTQNLDFLFSLVISVIRRIKNLNSHVEMFHFSVKFSWSSYFRGGRKAVNG